MFWFSTTAKTATNLASATNTASSCVLEANYPLTGYTTVRGDFGQIFTVSSTEYPWL